MTQRTQLLSQSIRMALATSFAVTGAAAMAQSDSDAKKLDTVVVTGSRIPRADRETAQPVIQVTREDIQKSGFTSVGDILQRLAEVGPSINTQFNNGGDGSTTIDLRNLGASRTLVLLNGRRWVPGLGGAVDINTIPTAIVESIDVLKDGSSAIYGSDAIAGVVNIITRKDFDGMRVSGFYGENSEGDGTRYSSDFSYGVVGERGSANLSASYVKEDPIFAGDREISAVPNFGLPASATGSSTTPLGRYFVTGRPGSFTNTGPQTPGPNTAAQYRAFNLDTDLFNFAPDNYLVTPQERYSIFGEGRYDLAEWVSFNSHFMFNQRKSEQLLAAIPVVLGNRNSGLAGTITVPANNAFNQLGGVVAGLQRRFVETGGRTFNQDNGTFRFGAGFNGAFDFADRYFTWDAGYSYTTVKETSLTGGQLSLPRIRTALSAIDNPATAAFDPVCVTPGATTVTAATTVAGCVPLNILGGVGSITPAMLRYISFTGQDRTETETTNFFASLAGTVVELPAGPLGFAAGIEYRKEAGFDLPDAITAAGETTGNSRSPTGGSYNLKEFYSEFAIPLLADTAFAELLELRLAGRYSDYNTFGDTSNFAAGFQWKPIADLKIRGNYNEGFRAPTILELFRGVSDNFPSLADPCSRGQFGTLNQQVPETVARCASGIAGIPPALVNGAPPIQDNNQIRTQVGGEATLTPEESKSYTLGFVYSPSWLEGADMSVDWWRVKIENVIGGRAAGTLLTQCYRDGNIQACGRVSRNAQTGQVSNILATGENVGFNDISGIDIGMGYRLPDLEFGQFSLRLDTTYFIEELSANLGFNPTTPFNYHTNNPTLSSVGLYGGRGGTTPRIKSTLKVDWLLGPWSANWTSRYTSGSVETCGAVYRALDPTFCSDPNLRAANNSPLPRNEIASATYHDASVAYASPWDSTIRVGAANITDKAPPFSTNTFANSFDPQNDVPGRFWYVSYSQNF